MARCASRQGALSCQFTEKLEMTSRTQPVDTQTGQDTRASQSNITHRSAAWPHAFIITFFSKYALAHSGTLFNTLELQITLVARASRTQLLNGGT